MMTNEKQIQEFFFNQKKMQDSSVFQCLISVISEYIISDFIQHNRKISQMTNETQTIQRHLYSKKSLSAEEKMMK